MKFRFGVLVLLDILLAHIACGQTVYTPYTFLTLAGSVSNSGFADGLGSTARFHSPHGTAVDSNGFVYVADLGNHVIRRISPAGLVSTWAGSVGVSGTNDGPGLQARFNSPWSLAVDRNGNLLVTDTLNHTIRCIRPDGLVTTVAGKPGVPGSANGTGSTAQFNHPHALATDTAGNIYVTDSYNHTIRKIAPGAVVTTLAGLPGTPGTANGAGPDARFRYPAGIAVDGADNIYVADEFNHTIRKLTTQGVVSTFAGSAGNRGAVDATGLAARFYNPHGCAVDKTGYLFVSEMNNGTVRRITPQGVVTTLAGLAGNTGSADGTGSTARFSVPRGGAVDALGNFYLPDFGNHTIRKGWALDAWPAISIGIRSDLSVTATILTGSVGALSLLEAGQVTASWSTNTNAVAFPLVPGVSYGFGIPTNPRPIKLYRVHGVVLRNHL